jgi:hypothetical protein
MARLAFLIAWLRGPRSFNRFALFYVIGMLFLFYCLLGGLPHIHAAPAHAAVSPYPAMPNPQPGPANAAEELRKRINNGPRISN